MAYKISVWIVLFLLFFNGGAVMLDVSGADEYLGVDAQPGSPEQLDKAQSTAKNYNTGNGGGSTLFGLYNTLTDTLEIIVTSVFPGAAMLENAGAPGWIVAYLFSGLAIVPGVDLLMFLRSG